MGYVSKFVVRKTQLYFGIDAILTARFGLVASRIMLSLQIFVLQSACYVCKNALHKIQVNVKLMLSNFKQSECWWYPTLVRANNSVYIEILNMINTEHIYLTRGAKSEGDLALFLMSIKFIVLWREKIWP